MSDLWDALQRRYSAPAYALFGEVHDATGARARRSADGIAVSLWPSRGLEIHGIECKASRGDWIRELKDPAKADKIQRYCDRWWLAVENDKIVLDGELPPAWGLLVLKGTHLVTKVAAPKLEPMALNRDFVVALLRRSGERLATMEASWKPPDTYYRDVETRVTERLKQEKANWELNNMRELPALRRRESEMAKAIEDLKTNTGVDAMAAWDYPNVAALMRCERADRTARQLQTRVKDVVVGLEEAAQYATKIRELMSQIPTPTVSAEAPSVQNPVVP